METSVHDQTEMLSNVSDDQWNRNRDIWPIAASVKAPMARSRSIIPRCPEPKTFPRLWSVPWNLDDLPSAWQLRVWWQVQFGVQGQVYQVRPAQSNCTWVGIQDRAQEFGDGGLVAFTCDTIGSRWAGEDCRKSVKAPFSQASYIQSYSTHCQT
jgi:hypothetical protein